MSMSPSSYPPEERSRSRPMHVTFDFFRRTNQQPCISNVECANHLVPNVEYVRSFADQNNNGVLLCAYLYICRSITRGLAGKLAEQLRKDIGPNSPAIINIPETYREHNHQETIAIMLLNGLVRLERVARSSFHELRAIQSEFISLVNLYPFFRFCLIVWLRLKAIREFSDAPIDEYMESVGNEVTVLSNYSTQLRGLPLDILCNVLGLRLCLRTSLQDEFYGGRKDKLDTERELHCFSLKGNTVLLQVEEEAQYISEKLEVSASGTSTNARSKPSWSCWDKSLSAQSSLKSFYDTKMTPTKPTSNILSYYSHENCRLCLTRQCVCDKSMLDILSPKSNHQAERRTPMFFHSNKASGNVAQWSKLNRRLPQ